VRRVDMDVTHGPSVIDAAASGFTPTG
jgi:hypothetical protein